MPWVPLPGDEPDPPRRVARSLDRVLRSLEAPRADTVRSVFDNWAEVVGPQLAAHTEPVRLRRGRLVVAVPDAAWATQVRFLEPQLLARLEEAFGAGEVSAIDVRVRPGGDGTRR